MTALPIALYWMLAIWGLFSRRPVLLFLFFATLPFGSLAVVPAALTAGLTFLPTPMTGLLLILKTFTNQQRLLIGIASALDLRRLGVLFAFWAVALVVTIFMPRLFAGVMIVPMRGDVSGTAPLFASAQNISQLAYLTISVTMVFAFAQILKTHAMRQTALHALVLAAAVTVVTGFLDFASQYVPLSAVLEPLRTATYTLLVGVELMGGKRVVGLMPEASSFGSLCLSLMCLLYFLRRGILSDRIRDVYVPPLIVALLVFSWLSTSSATYVGLAVFLVMATLEWLVRFLETRSSSLRRRHLGTEFALVVTAVAGWILIVLFKPSLIDALMQSINRIVLEKTASSSFEQRSMWTAASLKALYETYGVGVGLGGTRASNFVVAIASNVGVVGAIFYFGFIIQCLLRRAAPDDTEGKVLVSGLRYAFVPPFVVGLLVGTTPDPGGFEAFQYGLLTAIGLGGLFVSMSAASRRAGRRGRQMVTAR
jgi:hypothetical protein